MGGNRIQRLPATLGQLTQLKTLLLDRNEIENIPESITNLTGNKILLDKKKFQ